MKSLYESIFDIDDNVRDIDDKVYKINHPSDRKELQDSIKYHLQNGNYDLNCINTSKITDMSGLFQPFARMTEIMSKIDISEWDVSNVEDMSCMFFNCTSFNQPLNNWNVDRVKDMCYMFCGCKKFNQPLNNWDVSNVKKMFNMFCGCKKFNQPLNNWDVRKANIDNMFINCPIKDEYKPN